MRLKKLPKNKTGFLIVHDNENLDIYLNGKMIGNFNHDTVGWIGMEMAETMVRDIAKVLKIEVVVTNDEEIFDLVERLKGAGGL